MTREVEGAAENIAEKLEEDLLHWFSVLVSILVDRVCRCVFRDEGGLEGSMGRWL